MSPCRARCSPRSVGRLTSSSASSCSMVMSRGMRSWSSPFGPLTRHELGLDRDVDAGGHGDGLTADATSSQLTRRGRRPRLRRPRARASWPVITPLEVDTIAVPMPPWTLGISACVDIVALPRARHALQAAEIAERAVIGVLQRHADDLAGAFGGRRLEREVADVALLLEDAGHLALELRLEGMRTSSCAAVMPLRTRVRKSATGSVIDMADLPGATSSCRGCSRCARARAGRSGTRRTCGTPRAARPQRRQRVYPRVLYLAGRAWRTRWEVLAIRRCLRWSSGCAR